MFKRKILILTGIVLFLLAGIFISNKFKTPEPIKKVYPKAPLTVVLDWELTAPFVLQIYYTIDKDEKFSYKHYKKKKVTPKDKHIEIVLPEEKIYKFKMVFYTNSKRVVNKQIELKNVEIIADQYINFNDWESYNYKRIEKIKIHKKDNTVTLISSHRKPYMFWSYPFVLYKNE